VHVSYDLVVFDPSSAPRNRVEFLDWFEKQSECDEPQRWDFPETRSPTLNAWLQEIIKTFPPRNVPFVHADPDDPLVTDYGLGRSVISAAFAWSQAKSAYRHVKELALKHKIGFFDLSGQDGDIWWPVPGWRFTNETKGEIPLPLDLAFGPILINLDSERNSFCVLENHQGNYVQCGGGQHGCTVEFREYNAPAEYKHYVVGHTNGSSEPASVRMSHGEVTLQTGEILSIDEAAELFQQFFAGSPFPKSYSFREIDL
jgi:hypothetical protein